MFSYEDKQLNLAVNEAGLKLPESEQAAIVLYSGNFNYDLQDYEPGKGLERLESIVNNWQQDLEIYTDVVGKLTNQKVTANSSKDKEAVAV